MCSISFKTLKKNKNSQLRILWSAKISFKTKKKIRFLCLPVQHTHCPGQWGDSGYFHELSQTNTLSFWQWLWILRFGYKRKGTWVGGNTFSNISRKAKAAPGCQALAVLGGPLWAFLPIITAVWALEGACNFTRGSAWSLASSVSISFQQC